MDQSLARYDRQMRFAPLGEAGQARLAVSTVLVVGCGALGSVVANTLARAGVGTIRLVDRDFLELSNLQRQVLYDEADVAAQLPKAVAAAGKLRDINSSIVIEPFVADVTHKNIAELAAGCDAIVDGSDNFEVRFLVNDYAVSCGVPWVFGGCLGAEGQVLAIVPGETPCLACVVPEPPPPGSTPSCDSAGVLGPAINVVASVESMEVLKLLTGRREALAPKMLVVDLWRNHWRAIDVTALKRAGECPVCDHRQFRWLTGQRGSRVAVLCGRHAVQIRPEQPARIDLANLAAQLREVGPVLCNEYLLKLDVEGHSLTLFADGRAIVQGTDSEAAARGLYARYFGS